MGDAARDAEEKEKTEKQERTAQQGLPLAQAKNTLPDPPKASEMEILHSKLQTNTVRKEQIERQMKQLERNTNQIDKKMQYIKDREEGDTKNIAEADRYIKNLEASGPSWKEQKIETLSAYIKDLEERVLAKLDAAVEIKDPQKSEAQLREANSDLLQIGMLADKLAVMKGEKIMLDEKGEPVDSFDKAEFFVPANKQIKKDEQGNYYLLDQGKELDKLTDEERDKAQRDFAKQRQQLTSVRSDVERFRKQQQALQKEKGFLATAREALGLEKNKLQNEIDAIEKQLKQLDSQPGAQPTSQTGKESATMRPPADTPEPEPSEQKRL